MFTDCRRLPDGAPGLSKLIHAADFVFQPRGATEPRWDEARLSRLTSDHPFVLGLEVIAGDAASKLAQALDWPVAPFLRARVSMSAEGSLKPVDLARALGLEPAEIARVALVGLGAPVGGRAPDFDPLEGPPGVRSPSNLGVTCDAGSS